MTSAAATEPVPSLAQSSSKNKKTKKKKAGGKGKGDIASLQVNGSLAKSEELHEDDDDGEPETPREDAAPQGHVKDDSLEQSKPVKANGVESLEIDSMKPENASDSSSRPNATQPQRTTSTEDGARGPGSGDPSADTEARLDALVRERTALREEVAQLRRSLEEINEKHEDETKGLQDKLEDVQNEKEQAESQYRTLLGRVNTIKSQLGERLKADAEDLAQARSHIEDLEEQNATLKEQYESKVTEVSKLKAEEEERSKELSTLRNRLNLSTQNWAKEREDLVQREAYAKEEFESAKQAMQDWEILAMEERTIRESLTEKTAELEEQLVTHRDELQRFESERDSQSLTIDGLQRALQELQDARKRELREFVENSQAQVDALRKQLEEAQATSEKSTKALERSEKELERLLPFEAEAKEKNLLLLKVRHENVGLHENLRKALKQSKKTNPEDTINRQLVTNHFLQFLTLDRSDPKKFQILQIIASILDWNDDDKEKAGLARPGMSNPSLRTPISPWARTPSTPSLSTEFLAAEQRGRGESIGGAWTEFLETEAQGGRSTRSTSISSSRRH